MEAPSPAPPVARITAIDTVRGFAVLGILIMNVVGMAMPSAAYGDPRAYGGSGGADLIAWLAAFVIADRSEEHTSELQSLMRISYAVFCLKKKKNTAENNYHTPRHVNKNHNSIKL